MCMYFSTYYIVNIKILSPGLRAFKDNTKITVTWTILSGVPPTLGVKQLIDLVMVECGLTHTHVSLSCEKKESEEDKWQLLSRALRIS